jgi:hypothetical protein
MTLLKNLGEWVSLPGGGNAAIAIQIRPASIGRREEDLWPESRS